jgi:cytochrome b involved in lipid metabolism
VYNITKYLDNHPGGAEVLLDVAGKDADEFFEDIGHSKDARAELKKHLIGNLKLDEQELARRNAEKEKSSASNGQSNKFLLLLAILVVVWAYYFKGK